MGAVPIADQPLVLIAGLGQGAWIWEYVLPELRRERPVIPFEARGTGTLAHLSARRSVGEMAADVRAALDRPAHILGSSMGGYVAMTLALEAPELVRSLILVATGTGGPDRVPRPRHIAAAVDEALLLPLEEFARRTIDLGLSPGWPERNPDRFEEIVATQIDQPTPYELLESHAAACYRFYDEDCAVERIDVPALVVHGDLDVIVPVENGRALARRLRRCRYVELAGRGHNLMLEEPETFVRLVQEFLAHDACAA